MAHLLVNERERVVLLAVAAALWLCGVPTATAQIIDAESRIATVTVYPDRATVTRAVHMRLAKGPVEVRFAPLPSAVLPSSVTARGFGEATVTIFGVRVVTTQIETAQDPKVSTLEADIRTLHRRGQQLQNLKDVLEQEREYLSSILASSAEQLSKDLVTKAPNVADAASLLSFLDGSLLKNYEREQTATAELEDNSRQLDRLQRELGGLAYGQERQQTAVLVSLDVTDAGPLTLEISYQVPDASWRPTYIARSSSSGQSVELTTYGLIRQRTGEDWEDVQVTLSTAKPALAGSMPELQPWFVRPFDPVALQSRSARLGGELKEMADERMEKARKSQPAAPQAQLEQHEAVLATAAVNAQGPAVTFRLERPESIPGDWQPRKAPIASEQLKAQFAYEATPRLIPYAFLRAKITNTTDGMLLAGEVAVFRDGAFVSSASLKQVAPGEAFDLYLGIDERVKVERKPLKDFVQVSLLPGLRGKMKSIDQEHLTTIENFTGGRVSVVVFDQHPVSEREEIIVEAIRMSPETVGTDPEKPGVFQWKLDLLPGQKQELKLAYRLRHPVEMQVQW